LEQKWHFAQTYQDGNPVNNWISPHFSTINCAAGQYSSSCTALLPHSHPFHELSQMDIFLALGCMAAGSTMMGWGSLGFIVCIKRITFHGNALNKF
jgi:hypothetical protein